METIWTALVDYFSALTHTSLGIVELISVILGLIYVYYEYHARLFQFPVGILTSLGFIYVYGISRLYVMMGVQVYYVAVYALGWYHWSRPRPESGDTLPITKVPQRHVWKLVVGWLAVSAVLVALMYFFTDDVNPFGDGIAAAMTVVAMVMLAYKWIEQWLVWVLANILYIVVSIQANLYATAVMTTVYLVVSFMGWFHWKKLMKQQNE